MLRFACLAMALVVAAVGPSRAADFDKFLPKETDLVISVNIRQAFDSPLVKKYAMDAITASVKGNKEAQQAFQALGIDPLKDVDRVLIAAGLEDMNNPKVIILTEGRFDPKKIADLMEKLAKDDAKKFSVEKISGTTVYKIATPDQPVPMYAAPVSTSLTVFTTTPEIMSNALEAVKGTRAPVIKKEVAELIGKMDVKASLSIVAHTKGRLDAIPLPDPEMKKLIDQILSISIDLKVEKDVSLELAIGTPGVDESKKLRELIGGGLELAKIQVKVAVAQQPELQALVDLVNSMTATQKEKNVVITGKLTGEALEKSLNKK